MVQNGEKQQIYELEIPVSDLNEANGLKPYGYQKLFAQRQTGIWNI